MLPEPWSSVLRLLVVRLDNIGDMVMLTPALRSLRSALPDARITLMASPAGSQVASMLPWIDGVLVHRAVWQDLSGGASFSPAGEAELVRRLQAEAFDAAVIFTSFSQSPYPPAYACFLAGVPVRAAQSLEFGGGILTHWVRPLPTDTHQVDRNLWLLESLGFPAKDARLELQVPLAAEAQAERLLLQNGMDPDAPFLALAPVASCEARTYPLDRFAAVTAMLNKEGWPVALLGTERDRALSGDWGPRAANLMGQTTVQEFAAVIRRSAGVLGSHSGVMHIADAFERPMVILFSGTDQEEQWRPRYAPSCLLRVPTDCAPCRRFSCPYHLECLDISPEQVTTELLNLLPAKAEASA